MIITALLLATAAPRVEIPVSMGEFYALVEVAKREKACELKKGLSGFSDWVAKRVARGERMPEVTLPPPVILPGTTDRPKYAVREYRDGETIFLLGDSITQFANGHAFGYDKLLKRGLEVWGKKDVKVVNHGRSGATTTWMRKEAQKPNWDWLFLQGGINDANKDWWHDRDISGFTANVTNIVALSKAYGAQVILATTTCNGECDRTWWATEKRHLPSYLEDTLYNPRYRQIAEREQVPLIDFWHYWMGDGDYTGFIQTNKLHSLEKLYEGRGDLFLSYDSTHLYFQGYRDIARRLLTVMGCPAEKMPEIEKAWWSLPATYRVTVTLSEEEYKTLSARAAASKKKIGEFAHDLLFREDRR